MKKLFKLFILAMLAVCGVACEQLGGAHNGGNDNGDNSGDAPGTPGTTESVFNITVSDITSNSAYVSVETSSKETYYFDVVEKDYLDQYTNKNDYAEEYVAELKSLCEYYGFTLAEVLSLGNDGYLYDGDLDPNTSYYAFAIAVTEQGVVTSDMTLKQFKTLESANSGGSDEPSNNNFAITVSDITSNSATVSVAPSNSDTYYFDVVEKSVLDEYDHLAYAEALVAQLQSLLADYGYTLDMVLSSGRDSYSYDGNLDPNTEYYAYAFGLSADGTITTDVAVKAFTTLASGNGGGNTGGGSSSDKNLSCFVFGYYENWGDYYGTGATNWYIDLYSDSTNDYFVLELQGDLSEKAPAAGEYKILSSFAEGTAVAGGIDNEGYFYGTYWALFNDTWDSYVDYSICSSGTVKVGNSNGLYTINIDAVGANGNTIKVSYEGVLEEYVSDYSLAAQKLSNNLNKRFCTVSRMMKQKRIKVAPQASKKAVMLSPKKAVVAKPASKTLVKRAIK